MEKEQLIYNLFIEKLIQLLQSDEITDNQLKVVLKFLEDNDIKANPEKNKKLKDLANTLDLDVPFDIEEYPIER